MMRNQKQPKYYSPYNNLIIEYAVNVETLIEKCIKHEFSHAREGTVSHKQLSVDIRRTLCFVSTLVVNEYLSYCIYILSRFDVIVGKYH